MTFQLFHKRGVHVGGQAVVPGECVVRVRGFRLMGNESAGGLRIGGAHLVEAHLAETGIFHSRGKGERLA